MYLHVGQETILPFADIVGIFDLDNTTVSRHSRDFLKRAQEEGNIVDVTTELPKSFILCGSGKIYLSQISTATLVKRAQMFHNR